MIDLSIALLVYAHYVALTIAALIGVLVRISGGGPVSMVCAVVASCLGMALMHPALPAVWRDLAADGAVVLTIAAVGLWMRDWHDNGAKPPASGS